MNQIKIGKFISESRKSKKITQEQLAEKLGVSKNAVSKWERGMLLCKWHTNYFSVNTNVYTSFPFKIREFILWKFHLYIQKLSFGHTFGKCEMLRGARKIVRNPLFIRILKFRGVFSYPVVFFYIF